MNDLLYNLKYNLLNLALKWKVLICVFLFLIVIISYFLVSIKPVSKPIIQQEQNTIKNQNDYTIYDPDQNPDNKSLISDSYLQISTQQKIYINIDQFKILFGDNSSYTQIDSEDLDSFTSYKNYSFNNEHLKTNQPRYFTIRVYKNFSKNPQLLTLGIKTAQNYFNQYPNKLLLTEVSTNIEFTSSIEKSSFYYIDSYDMCGFSFRFGDNIVSMESHRAKSQNECLNYKNRSFFNTIEIQKI
jgi:hypothetical protein